MLHTCDSCCLKIKLEKLRGCTYMASSGRGEERYCNTASLVDRVLLKCLGRFYIKLTPS